MKRRILFNLFIVFIIALAVGCGNQATSSPQNGSQDSNNSNEEETLLIRVGNVVNERHILNLGSIKFKEVIEEKSNGRIKVEIFPSMQLGGEADMMEQLKNGTLEMLTPTIATLSSRSEAFSAWYMPYVLGSVDATNEMRKTDIAHEILNSLDPSEGAKPLGYYTIENRHVFSSKEIRTVDDFNGLKVRIPPGQAIGDFYQALNASPTPVEQQEVYTALQTGVVDAVDADVDGVVTNRYYEVAQNLSLTGHHDWVCAVLFSQVVWDKLSEEDRNLIEESVRIAEDYSYEVTKQLHEELLQEAIDNGVQLIEFEDMDNMLKIAEQIHEKYSSNPLIAEFIEKGKEINAQFQ